MRSSSWSRFLGTDKSDILDTSNLKVLVVVAVDQILVFI